MYEHSGHDIDLCLLQALGKTGKVIKIYSDGDLRVALDVHGHIWTFNPLSVVPVSSGMNAMAAQDNANRSRDRSGTFIFSIYINLLTLELKKVLHINVKLKNV